MGEHWQRVGEIAQVLVGNALLLALWIILLTGIQKLLVVTSGSPQGPILLDYLPVKKIIEAGELFGLIGLIVLSAKDIIKIVRR